MYSVWILFTGSPPVRCEWCTDVLPNVSVCTVYGYCSQVHHLLDVSGAQLCFLMSLYVWVYPGGVLSRCSGREVRHGHINPGPA